MSQNIDDYNSLLADIDDSDEATPNVKRARYDVNKILLEKFNKLEANQQNLVNLISRLTEEVLLTKREVKKLVEAKDISKENILPQTSFTTIEEFLKFDDQIKEPKNSKILAANILSRVSATCNKDFVFKSWRLLLTDSVAKEFNWSGSNNKTCVSKLATTAALQDAFLTKYPQELEIYHQKTKKYFTYAKDRLSKHEKYASKS